MNPDVGDLEKTVGVEKNEPHLFARSLPLEEGKQTEETREECDCRRLLVRVRASRDDLCRRRAGDCGARGARRLGRGKGNSGRLQRRGRVHGAALGGHVGRVL